MLCENDQPVHRHPAWWDGKKSNHHLVRIRAVANSYYLSHHQRHVLLALSLTMMGDRDYCWYSNRELAELAGLSTSSLSRSLDQLTKMGLVYRSPVNPGGTMRTYVDWRAVIARGMPGDQNGPLPVNIPASDASSTPHHTDEGSHHSDKGGLTSVRRGAYQCGNQIELKEVSKKKALKKEERDPAPAQGSKCSAEITDIIIAISDETGLHPDAIKRQHLREIEALVRDGYREPDFRRYQEATMDEIVMELISRQSETTQNKTTRRNGTPSSYQSPTYRQLIDHLPRQSFVLWQREQDHPPLDEIQRRDLDERFGHYLKGSHDLSAA